MDDHNENSLIGPAPAQAPATEPVKTMEQAIMKEEGGAQHSASDVPAPVARQPEMLNGVKVYPPSFVPAKAALHTPKKALIYMDLIHIEGMHIGFFILCTIFLFYGMWKRPNLR